MSDKKKKTIILLCNILMTLFLIVAVGALFYPYISNHILSASFKKETQTYNKDVSNMNASYKQAMIQEAVEYNKKLVEKELNFNLNEEELEEYNKILDVRNDGKYGLIGRIEIPSIDVSLLIYHTVDDAVLSAGIGHQPGTSFPVGGASTHTVLTGHRGLTSSTLFTNLDKVVVGDVIYLSILEEDLAYKVNDIEIVLPDEVDSLKIKQGSDLITLVTCTPYGINSHRILVHGERIDLPQVEDVAELTKSRITVGLDDILALFGVALILIILIIMILKKKKKLKERID